MVAITAEDDSVVAAAAAAAGAAAAAAAADREGEQFEAVRPFLYCTFKFEY